MHELPAATLGPVELPVALLVGDPATAQPTPLGTVHVALCAEEQGVSRAGGPMLVRLVPAHPDDLAHQLAALLDRHAAALRLPTLDTTTVDDEPAEGVPGAAPHA